MYIHVLYVHADTVSVFAKYEDQELAKVFFCYQNSCLFSMWKQIILDHPELIHQRKSDKGRQPDSDSDLFWKEISNETLSQYLHSCYATSCYRPRREFIYIYGGSSTLPEKIWSDDLTPQRRQEKMINSSTHKPVIIYNLEGGQMSNAEPVFIYYTFMKSKYTYLYTFIYGEPMIQFWIITEISWFRAQAKLNLYMLIITASETEEPTK